MGQWGSCVDPGSRVGVGGRLVRLEDHEDGEGGAGGRRLGVGPVCDEAGGGVGGGAVGGGAAAEHLEVRPRGAVRRAAREAHGAEAVEGAGHVDGLEGVGRLPQGLDVLVVAACNRLQSEGDRSITSASRIDEVMKLSYLLV